MRTIVLVLTLALGTPQALAGSAALKRGADGHWHAESRVNGRSMTMLVDTGASLVALTQEDARRAGIDVRHLRYDRTVRTASGTARAALVQLDRVQIGAVRLREVDAMVIERGLTTSLLGQSFLNRLEAYQVRGQLLRLQN
jgi:aspartyl protease family protein